MVRGWRSGWLCGLGLLCLCVFVAEGGGKKKKSLLVLPVDYVEGMTGSAKASELLTDELKEVVKNKKRYRLLSPTLGFQQLAGVAGDPSSLEELLKEKEKPDDVVYVKVTKVEKHYTLRGVLYRKKKGRWGVHRARSLRREGKPSDVSGWLIEMYDALCPPEAGERKTFFAGGVEFAMRWIPAGSFVMGSPSSETALLIADCKRTHSEAGCRAWFGNASQRRVWINRGYWMLETEVTQGQYKALMGSNPSHFKKCGENCPVDWVSWNDARAFANKLSEAEKLAPCTKTDRGIFACKGWRLPTEAEWEYAARAGTTTAYHTGDCVSTTEANYDGNYPQQGCAKGEYRKKTIAVCSLARNAWGLCDTHGNVWEWTMDVYGSYEGLGTQDPLRSSGDPLRVIRGGSWNNNAANYVRSAFRGNGKPPNQSNDVGFRLLRY